MNSVGYFQINRQTSRSKEPNQQVQMLNLRRYQKEICKKMKQQTKSILLLLIKHLSKAWMVICQDSGEFLNVLALHQEVRLVQLRLVLTWISSRYKKKVQFLVQIFSYLPDIVTSQCMQNCNNVYHNNQFYCNN